MQTVESSTNRNIHGVRLGADGSITLTLRVAVRPDESDPEANRDRLSPDQVRELRQLVDNSLCPDVQRAARAVVMYANGSSMEQAVAETPYGVGWLRGLLKAIKQDGVGALATRRYRAARN